MSLIKWFPFIVMSTVLFMFLYGEGYFTITYNEDISNETAVEQKPELIGNMTEPKLINISENPKYEAKKVTDTGFLDTGNLLD